MRPVIGLTARTFWYDSGRRQRLAEMTTAAFLDAVTRAGGLPIVLATRAGPECADAYLDRLDGLLLTGGEDVHPHLFGGEPQTHIDRVDLDRDRFEIALVHGARDRRMPLLAACRGIQLLNVARGGDLVQDIAAESGSTLAHAQLAMVDGPWHGIEVREGSLLARILRPGRMAVNSFHHQACRRLGEGLAAVATAPDGTVEALEDASQPFCLGVQWHPELSAAAGDPDSERLFSAFIQACAGGKPRAASNLRRDPIPGR